MEIRIVITDGGASGASPASISVESGSSGSGGPSAQERVGAIDGGPAPSAATIGSAGTPQAFVGQPSSAPGAFTSADAGDESGGAAPGTGSEMAVSTVEVVKRRR